MEELNIPKILEDKTSSCNKYDIEDLVKYLAPFVKRYTQEKYSKYIDNCEKELKYTEDEFSNLPDEKFIEAVKRDYMFTNYSKEHNEYYKNYVGEFLEELKTIRSILTDKILKNRQRLELDTYDEFLSSIIKDQKKITKMCVEVSKWIVCNLDSNIVNVVKLYDSAAGEELYRKEVYYWSDLLLFEAFGRVGGGGITHVRFIRNICDVILNRIIREYKRDKICS